MEIIFHSWHLLDYKHSLSQVSPVAPKILISFKFRCPVQIKTHIFNAYYEEGVIITPSPQNLKIEKDSVHSEQQHKV